MGVYREKNRRRDEIIKGDLEMILYLSSLLEDGAFASFVRSGNIKGGHQAQRFNSLVARGLSCATRVVAISNPPYNNAFGGVKALCAERDNIKYISVSSNNSRLHKLKNFTEMRGYIKKELRGKTLEAVVCDAINPLASLNAIRVAKKKMVPAIAIVTDIPEYMSRGKKGIFIRLTSYLMKKYDGYVLLTEAMNELVNPRNAPYIVMEGLCESGKDPAEAKQGNQDRALTCLYTGSLNDGTGIEELVCAISLMKSSDIELKIYGNGKLADWIAERGKTDRRIGYCGIVTNAEAVQAQMDADLLINPRPDDIAYRNVSFPSKVMEYMASGTPLLTTKLPGIPKEYFDYLYTIDDCSAEGIAKAISDVTSRSAEEREDMGKRAREFVLREKNNVKQAERIMALIEEIRNK